MKWENLIVVVDVETKIAVNRFAHQEWPQMIPSTNNIVVRPWRGFHDFTDNDWNSFNIQWPSLERSLERSTITLSPVETQRLQLERKKSTVAWRWLNVLYSLNRSVSGMIPGIDIANTPAEEDLIRQERETVRALIKSDLKTHWHRIWNCSSLDELETVTTEINMTSRNSQAFS